jgi:hypothetical protein
MAAAARTARAIHMAAAGVGALCDAGLRLRDAEYLYALQRLGAGSTEAEALLTQARGPARAEAGAAAALGVVS